MSYKYTDPLTGAERTIFLQHVCMVSYVNNTVEIKITSGDVISIHTTTETLYETLIEKVVRYWERLENK